MISALHEGAWTLDEVQGTLQDLFDRQYILTEDVVVEVRYRTVTRTDSEGNDYEVAVPYNYYICYVTLENFNLSHVPVYMMSEEQLSMYALYMSTLGNRPDLFPSSGYKQMLAPFVQGNPNLFYMVKAGGVFKSVHTQSWNICRKPYPVLSEAAKSWNEFRFENTRGNVIAVWCQRYVGGICMPDWHFHYLSSDKTQGGHVLDLSVERLHLTINRIGRFNLLLPQTSEFARCELHEG